MSNPFNQTDIKKALARLVEAYGLTDRLQEVEVKKIWERTMGPFIIKHTRSVTFKDGKLTVFVNSSVIRAEMNMVKSSIMEKLNAELKKNVIRQIEIF
jgi:predicted nucleic acid-binding Zn ribbon protein